MGHFSRFIPRGSVRVAASNTTETDLMFTAAVTPKNELIVVVLNTQDNGNARTYELEIQGKYVRTVIPGHGIHTIKYDL